MGGYDAASSKRRIYRTWRPDSSASDRDDLPDLPRLRTLSRDAYRNQPIVTGGIETKLYNTIGSGLTLQSTPSPEILGITPEAASEWAKRTEAEFALWSESVDCDAERTKSFGEIQTVAFISSLVSGDMPFMLPYIDRGGPYSMTVRLMEADRLCNPGGSPDTAKTAGGVSVDEYGAPISYRFSKNHPGGLSTERAWVEIPAYAPNGRRNVYLLARRTRPEQRRGVPLLAPVLSRLKTLGDYTDAELEAALVSGLFTVFVKTEAGDLPNPLGDTTEGQQAAQDDAIALKPGMMVGLAPGEDITTADPSRPNANYAKFVEAILMEIGAAIQVPYEMLIKHFSSSYSASRAALLEAWKAFKSRRKWFATGFCQLIYEEWLWEAVLIGRIDAPGFVEDPLRRKAWASAIWNGPAPGQLDPLKETNAAVRRVEEGFSTRQREAAELNGSDFEQNVAAALRENKLIEEAGLKMIDNSKARAGG